MTDKLEADAMRIWRAGVDAVRGDLLVSAHVRVAEDWLEIGDLRIALTDVRRLVVVGGGKAGRGMAAGLEQAFGDSVAAEKLTGWLNVPAGCDTPLSHIHLHPARPAERNEPTAAGVEGTEKILQLVGSLEPNDVCICLLSGGGSALLPAPCAGVTLEDKQAVARHLSGAGANIWQLNTVRKHLSRIKGGGLARACRADRLITLVISDVLGDPLDVIASGPTVADPTTNADALAVLQRFDGAGRISDRVDRALSLPDQPEPLRTTASHFVIGNNATAVDAAGMEAERLGYRHVMVSATEAEGTAEDVAAHFVHMTRHMRRNPGQNCLVSGGEPVVELAPESVRGRGGRNQQLALAALAGLTKEPQQGAYVVLSGGTDGEDGPTDAAGAWISPRIAELAREQRLDIADYLRRNDAYSFFDRVGALIRTGPTDTNVCDLRVVLVGD